MNEERFDEILGIQGKSNKRIKKHLEDDHLKDYYRRFQ